MSQITWSTEPGLGAVPVPILSERQAPLQKRPRPTGGTSPPPVTATHCGAGSSCPERSPESQAASRRRESPRRQSQGTSRDVSDHRPKPRERAKLGRADTSSEWTRHPVEPGQGHPPAGAGVAEVMPASAHDAAQEAGLVTWAPRVRPGSRMLSAVTTPASPHPGWYGCLGNQEVKLLTLLGRQGL